MADMVFKFDVRLSPRVVRWGLGGLLVCMMAGELGSESVTLSTYYPAPSGVYTRMITTNATYLARDNVSGAERVGIGNTDPQEKLHVLGKVIAGPNLGGGAPGSEPFHSRGNGAGYSLENRVNNNNRWVLYADSVGGVESFRIWDGTWGNRVIVDTAGQMGVGIDAAIGNDPRATLDVGTVGGGSIIIRRTCSSRDWTLGNCPFGQYATLVPGLYANRWELGAVGVDVNNSPGWMMCCTGASSTIW